MLGGNWLGGRRVPDVSIKASIAFDSPAHSLLVAAAGAQLIVVGSRGRGVCLVLGSVSNALLQTAPGPVAVVRASRGG